MSNCSENNVIDWCIHKIKLDIKKQKRIALRTKNLNHQSSTKSKEKSNNVFYQQKPPIWDILKGIHDYLLGNTV